MADLSIEAANRIGDWLLVESADPTRPTFPLKVALFSVMPNPQTGEGGTEMSGASYARASVEFSAMSSGATSNNADITFPAATDAWDNLVGLAVYDSDDSEPVMLFTGTFPTTVNVASGQTFKIPQGSLVWIFQ